MPTPSRTSTSATLLVYGTPTHTHTQTASNVNVRTPARGLPGDKQPTKKVTFTVPPQDQSSALCVHEAHRLHARSPSARSRADPRVREARSVLASVAPLSHRHLSFDGSFDTHSLGASTHTAETSMTLNSCSSGSTAVSSAAPSSPSSLSATALSPHMTERLARRLQTYKAMMAVQEQRHTAHNPSRTETVLHGLLRELAGINAHLSRTEAAQLWGQPKISHPQDLVENTTAPARSSPDPCAPEMTRRTHSHVADKGEAVRGVAAASASPAPASPRTCRDASEAPPYMGTKLWRPSASSSTEHGLSHTPASATSEAPPPPPASSSSSAPTLSRSPRPERASTPRMAPYASPLRDPHPSSPPPPASPPLSRGEHAPSLVMRRAPVRCTTPERVTPLESYSRASPHDARRPSLSSRDALGGDGPGRQLPLVSVSDAVLRTCLAKLSQRIDETNARVARVEARLE